MRKQITFLSANTYYSEYYYSGKAWYVLCYQTQ